mmetsp:Transcript_25140/g.70223  ORF Transcript_25140/g.70223 Transcript_25140/m.70223 type:complete len:805 (+) Transcript_25140:60-2474(+)
MEDRAVCIEDLASVNSLYQGPLTRFYAVFDGHEGQMASQYAADHLHSAFAGRLVEAMACQQPPPDRLATLTVEEALQAAIAEVDAAILRTAAAEDLTDGTTAVVAVLWEAHLLVANIGDSKALLCVDKEHQQGNSAHNMAFMAAKELTRDHSLAREDERTRVEAHSGRAVRDGNRLRLNGDLAVTRALGDLPFRAHGLISKPEFFHLELHALPPPQGLGFLLLASDGVFEGLRPAEVCALAGAVSRPERYPAFQAASPAAKPIPLGPKQDTSQSSSSFTAEATGGPQQQLQGSRHHWGLMGCLDCELGVTLAPSKIAPQEARRLMGTAARGRNASLMAAARIAQAVLKESFNRMSMDNTAAVVVPLSAAGQEAEQARIPVVPHPVDLHAPADVCSMPGEEASSDSTTCKASIAPQVVLAARSSHRYQLDRLLALVPRATRNIEVQHRGWDGQPVPSGLTRACTDQDCLVLRLPEPEGDAAEQALCDTSSGLCNMGQQAGGGGSGGGPALGALMELPTSTSSLIVSLASLPMDSEGALAAASTAAQPTGDLQQEAGTSSKENGRWSHGWLHAQYAEYKLQGAFAKGAFGEVWRCTRVLSAHHSDPPETAAGQVEEEAYVLKRIMVELGTDVRLSGERERYFGEIFRQQANSLMGSWPGAGGPPARPGDQQRQQWRRQQQQQQPPLCCGWRSWRRPQGRLPSRQGQWPEGGGRGQRRAAGGHAARLGRPPRLPRGEQGSRAGSRGPGHPPLPLSEAARPAAGGAAALSPSPGCWPAAAPLPPPWAAPPAEPPAPQCRSRPSRWLPS